MRVRVRAFGGLTEALGASVVAVELAEPATVGSLRDELSARHPALAGLLARTSVAVDLEVVDDTRVVRSDSEVALLPPVAGGADVPGPDEPVIVTGLRTPPFDVPATLSAIADPATGGTTVFLGSVRDHAPDADGVVRLDYSAYEPMAERELALIAEETLGAYPQLTGIALLHAVGDLPVGEHTVLIACASAHRDAAFDACRRALEEVKRRVPVFKREVFADGSHRWVGLPAPTGAGTGPLDGDPVVRTPDEGAATGPGSEGRQA